MQMVKLSKQQVKELHSHLAEAPLENYEFLWVLDSCLETFSSTVYGLGAHPWSAGLFILHRQCIWLRLENELFLETMLAALPEMEVFRFYSTKSDTIEMMKRWFPNGQLAQSRLCVRNLTKTWRKRFDVSLQVNPDPSTTGGQTFTVFASDQGLIASCSSQQAVPPWHEIMNWSLEAGQDIAYWTEQAFGAVTAELLAEGNPIIVRVDDDELYGILESLGYREFSNLYYYVASSE